MFCNSKTKLMKKNCGDNLLDIFFSKKSLKRKKTSNGKACFF